MLKGIMFTVNKDKKEVSPVETRTFKQAGLEERKDLQEWIAKSPNIFGEELLIIQKEFDKFDKTAERFDLLALDKKGCLVIIENKRDTSDKNVVWQALKYGAYCSTLKTSQIISIYQNYLDKYDKGNAEEKISEFFDNDNIETLDLNAGENQRFILVAGKFPPEVTSTALWLIKNNIDVQCFKVALFSLKDDLLLNVSKIIPIPDAEDYMIRLAEKNVEEKQTAKTNSIKTGLHLKFWEKILSTFNKHNISNFSTRSPSELSSMRGGVIAIAQCEYQLHILKDSIRVRLYIDSSDSEENKQIYDSIHKEKELLEKNLGYEMIWNQNDNTRSCQISYSNSKKLDSYNEENWDEMIEWFVEHFQNIEKNVRSIIEKNGFHK